MSACYYATRDLVLQEEDQLKYLHHLLIKS